MYSKEEKKQLTISFWNGFKDYCHDQSIPNKWMLNQTKVSGVALRFETTRENANVILELQNKNEDRRLQIFEVLERYKVVVEDGFQNGLTWEFYHKREDNQQEVCRIYTMLENVDIHRKNQWTEIYDFFIENMTKLEHNFLEVRDILKEELRG